MYRNKKNGIIGIVITIIILIIIVIFSNGEKKIFDANYLLDIPIYSPLKDEVIWNGLVVVDGIVTWDDENLDIAPETLYLNSVKCD